MNFRLLVLVLGVGILGFTSCKKKKLVYVIEGIITDLSFNQPLANVDVTVELKKAGITYFTTLTSIKTDANGKYSFELENGLYEEVKISTSLTNYFDREKLIPFGDINENSNVYNFTTYAKSWARLIFRNLNPQSTDKLSFIKKDGLSNCAECCPSTETYLYGAVNDTVICVNNGNSVYSYNYFVIGTSNAGLKSVYTTPFDTTELVLEY